MAGLARFAGACGIGAVAAFAANIMFTTDGPRPDEPAAAEAARIANEATQIRASALLLLIEALPTLAFLVVLAVVMARLGSLVLAVTAVAFGATATAVSVVSAAALASAPAVTELGPGLVLALGDLHTTTLLAAASLLGVSAVAIGSGPVLPRWSRVSATGVGITGILSGAIMAVDDFDLGAGPLAIALFLWFLGWPLWLLATSIRLVTRGATAVSVTQDR